MNYGKQGRQINKRIVNHILTVVSVAAFGVLSERQLLATTYFSNLGQSTDNSDRRLYGTGYRLATDFLTATSATYITSATLKLEQDDLLSHTFTLSLFTDSGSGTPGTLVGSFNNLTLAYNPSMLDRTFSSGGIALASNTIYWAVLQINENPSTIGPEWACTSSQTTDAGSEFSTISATQVKESFNNGATWSDLASGNFQLSLAGTVVPEPAASALVGVGVGLLGLYLLHCRKS